MGGTAPVDSSWEELGLPGVEREKQVVKETRRARGEWGWGGGLSPLGVPGGGGGLPCAPGASRQVYFSEGSCVS